MNVPYRNLRRFVNLRFTVEDGASLVFDMPKTQFGPNSEGVCLTVFGQRPMSFFDPDQESMQPRRRFGTDLVYVKQIGGSAR